MSILHQPRLKRTCLLILCHVVGVIAPFQLWSQMNPVCGTDMVDQSNTPEFVHEMRSQMLPARAPMQYVPVKFHVIGASNGALAIDTFHIFNELVVVNSFFQDANIQFIHCGNVNFIYDNDYILFIKNEDEVLCDIHDNPEVINIYFAHSVERADGESLCGYAYNYNLKPRVIMDNGCSTNGSTLAHELGHSFSLLHTHSTSLGVEFVDGSNCGIAGDLLCDTPADPRLSSSNVNTSCSYTGNDLDPNNQAYAPDTKNVMSYSRKSCREYFSQEQLLQMTMYHSVHQDLLACVQDSFTQRVELDPIKATSIYPTVIDDELYIKNLPQHAQISIINSMGHAVFMSDRVWTEENVRLQIFSGLTSGFYFVQIVSDGRSKTQKVFKN